MVFCLFVILIVTTENNGNVDKKRLEISPKNDQKLFNSTLRNIQQL